VVAVNQQIVYRCRLIGACDSSKPSLVGSRFGPERFVGRSRGTADIVSGSPFARSYEFTAWINAAINPILVLGLMPVTLFAGIPEFAGSRRRNVRSSQARQMSPLIRILALRVVTEVPF
jgi:hypothetical protein